MTSEPEQLRTRRLVNRVERSAAPLVWLRGMAGTGKSQLLGAIRERSGPATERLVFDLDAPEGDEVAATAKAVRDGMAAGYRILIASRPSSSIERILLRAAAYGRTEVVADAELFYRQDELQALRPGDGDRLFAETGGWPLLVGAALDDRSGDMRRMLPEFLNTEGLTSLPHDVVVALFAAAEAPFPLAAAIELFGSIGDLHPLLHPARDGVALVSSWCVEAILALKARPNLWRRATADSLVRVYARHGDPARAIMALNALGQSRLACSVYEEAGGPFLAFRQGSIPWKGLIDGFPLGLGERKESLILGRVWEALAAGRPAIALSRLEAHFPGLPIDLRTMRYAHRPNLILFRLLIEADFLGSLPRETVESWYQLDALLRHGESEGRALLMLAIVEKLAQLGDLTTARRRLQAWINAEPVMAPGLDQTVRLRLAQLSIALGDLAAASRELAMSEASEGSKTAITDLLAYERGDAALTRWPDGFVSDLDQSWPSLSLELMRVSSCICLQRDGLAAALEQLSDHAAQLRRRHCGIDERTVQILKIRLHQMARRHAEAAGLLAGLGRPASPEPSVTDEALARLRALAADRRQDMATIESALSASEALSLTPRGEITLHLLRAHFHYRAGEGGDCRRQMAAALRLAAKEHQIAPLIEDSELAEAPLAQLLAHRATFPETLVEFAEFIARKLRSTPASAIQARDTAGLSRQEHRVLDQLCDGKSNKEIARSLGITDSTVKFHLRNLFAKFEVSGRKDLIDAARRQGVVR